MAGVDTSMYDPLIRPVAPENPLDMASKAADLKTAIVRSQMAPIELQRQQEEAAKLHQANQTSAEDAADQKTLQQLYGEVQSDASVPPEKKNDELRSRAAGKVKPRTLEALSTQMEAHQRRLMTSSCERQARWSARRSGRRAARIQRAGGRVPTLSGGSSARVARSLSRPIPRR